MSPEKDRGVDVLRITHLTALVAAKSHYLAG
jgi:hypothetical protein